MSRAKGTKTGDNEKKLIKFISKIENDKPTVKGTK